MKIIKYAKKTKDKYQLFLDNGEVLDTYEDVILKNNLLYNKDLNNDSYENITKDNELQKNYNACLNYIKVRLRSKKEIEDYLKRKKVSETDIEEIVDKLIKNNLINDDYFCKCFINDKLKFTSMGEYKIINELKNLRIDDEIINKYNYLFDKELLDAKIIKLIEKYIKASKKKNNVKNKIYTNLMNLGYDKDQIIENLNKYNFHE